MGRNSCNNTGAGHLPEHCFAAWPRATSLLGKSHILLFVDFDGTLAPIADRPSEAVMPAGTRTVLKELRSKNWCTIAVISGRALPDLMRRVGIEGIFYGGSHGAQLTGPNIDFLAPLPVEAYRALDAIKSDLRSSTASIRGVAIEDKTFSLSVHFRQAAEADLAHLHHAVHRITQQFVDGGQVRIGRGKKVFDIVPSSWDKGNAVKWLLSYLSSYMNLQNIMPVYIGDDATDEDAFAVIARSGLTVAVGNGRASLAQYWLRDTDEVFTFLEKICRLRDQ